MDGIIRKEKIQISKINTSGTIRYSFVGLYVIRQPLENNTGVKYYPPTEEKINIISHAFGFLLSFAGLLLLLIKTVQYEGYRHCISVGIFGVSLMLLYAASTVYHSAKKPERRQRLRIVDHASIYLLIAGTYTPFVLITLYGQIGWLIFGAVWGMAIAGIVLKLFYTGRYNIVSTIMYVFMGWIIIFAIKPLIQNLSSEGLTWLMAGGIAYTAGAALYSIKKLKYNHAIFHVFVVLGSCCHFVSVYFYVLADG